MVCCRFCSFVLMTTSQICSKVNRRLSSKELSAENSQRCRFFFADLVGLNTFMHLSAELIIRISRNSSEQIPVRPSHTKTFANPLQVETSSVEAGINRTLSREHFVTVLCHFVCECSEICQHTSRFVGVVIILFIAAQIAQVAQPILFK